MPPNCRLIQRILSLRIRRHKPQDYKSPSTTAATVTDEGAPTLVQNEESTELAASHWGGTHGTFRTLAVSVSALLHFNFDGF
jgi:hypothetical protein